MGLSKTIDSKLRKSLIVVLSTLEILTLEPMVLNVAWVQKSLNNTVYVSDLKNFILFRDKDPVDDKVSKDECMKYVLDYLLAGKPYTLEKLPIEVRRKVEQMAQDAMERSFRGDINRDGFISKDDDI